MNPDLVLYTVFIDVSGVLILLVTFLTTLLFGQEIWLMGMVFNATFNNISAISWRSLLLVVEETGDEWTTYTKQMLLFNI
jgi:hypothetical protein